MAGTLMAAAFAPLASLARAETGRRIVAVLDVDRPGARAAYDRFVHAMQERGIPDRFGVEARFVPVDQADEAQLAALPGRLASLRPAVVIATSLPTTLAVRSLGIPVIFFVPAGDPVAFGIAQSIRRPGGHMTGYAGRLASPEKMLEILADGLPAVKRVAIPTDALFEKYALDRKAVAEASRTLGMRVELVPMETIGDFEGFVARRLRGFDAMAIPYIGVPFRHGERMIAELNRLRVPALFGSGRLAQAGALIGIEAEIADSAETFARQLEAICLGMPPGEIPIERPKLFRLTLNLATARRIGVRFPPQFVIRADKVLT